MKEIELLFNHHRHPQFDQVCLSIGSINPVSIDNGPFDEKISFIIDCFRKATPFNAVSGSAHFNISKNPYEGKLKKFALESALTQQSDLVHKDENFIRFCLLIGALICRKSRFFLELCLKIRFCLSRGDNIDSSQAIDILKTAYMNRESIVRMDVKVNKNDTLMGYLNNLIKIIANNSFRISKEFEDGILKEVYKNKEIDDNKKKNTKDKSKFWPNKIVGLSPYSPELMTTSELTFCARLIRLEESNNPGLAFIASMYSWTGRELSEILDMKWGIDLFDDHFVITVSPSDQIAKPIKKEGYINSDNRVRINLPECLIHLLHNLTKDKSLTSHPSLRVLTRLDENDIQEFGKAIAKCLRNKFPRLRVTTIFSQAKKQNFRINRDMTLVFIMHQKKHWIENVEYHYCQYPHSTINQQYQQLFEKLMLGKGAKEPINNQKVVGANGIIKANHLKPIISQKQNIVKKAVLDCLGRDKKDLNNNEHFIDSVNELTLFTAFQFFAETVARPTKTFFNSRTKHIVGSNIILIKDKHDINHQWERAIVLSDDLNSNLQKIKAMRNYLCRKLTQEKYGPIFQIIDGESLRPLTRKDLNEYLGQNEDIISRLRATCRTYGVAHEINIKDLRMQLGHHLSTRHHIGKCSTDSYFEWENEVLKFTNAYSNELGFSEMEFPPHSNISNIEIKSILKPEVTTQRKETEKKIKERLSKLFGDNTAIPFRISEDFYLDKKASLSLEFDNETMCEALLMSKFKTLKLDGHKLDFSLKNPPKPEKPPLNFDNASRLQQGLMLQHFLAKKDISKIKTKEKHVYEWLKIICFSFAKDFAEVLDKNILKVPSEEELKSFCKGVLSPSKVSAVKLLEIAKALGIYYLPGILFNQLDKINFKNKLEPVAVAISERRRPTFSVKDEVISKQDNNVSEISSANEVKIQFLALSKNMSPGKYTRRRRELVHALNRLTNNRKVTFLGQTYINWLCDRVINGGVIKPKLEWRSIKQYASIARHLDRMLTNKKLDKLTQKQFNELLSNYCKTKRGQDLGKHRKVVESFGRFVYENVIGINDYPTLQKFVGIKNILFQHEFDYLFDILEKHESSNSNNYTQKLLLVLGFIFGLRRNEVKGLLFSDIQIVNKTNSVNIRYYSSNDRAAKTTNSRRVIKVDNLPPKIFKLFVDLNSTESKLSLKSIFEHLCRYDSVIEDCFFLLVHKIQKITGDPLFRFHWLRTSRANSVIESSLSCKLPTYKKAPENHPRFLGHSSLNVTVDKYGVYLNRLYEQYRFSLRRGWTDTQIECLTGLKAENIRKKRSRYQLGKNPISISSLLTKNHLPKIEKVKFNQLADSDFVGFEKGTKDKNIFRLVLLELINKRQLIIDTFDNTLNGNFLELRFCKENISFLDKKHEPNAKDISKIIDHFKNIKYKLPADKPKPHSLRQLLQLILLQLSSGRYEFELSSNQAEVFNSLMSSFELSDSTSATYQNKIWTNKLSHGLHPLAFPRATKTLLELIYLTLILENI